MAYDPQTLRDEVYRCELCADRGFGFSRVAPDAPLSKFPPTIGSAGAAPLLFIGTNPRISNTNRDLYAKIMRDRAAFDSLACDEWSGRSYLRFGEPGRHYDLHLEITRLAFPGREFSSMAAVTELFLCATLDATTLPQSGSACADLYLDRVARQVQPRVVVTVGSPARRYMEGRRVVGTMPFRAGLGDTEVVVAAVPHPAAWGGKGTIGAHIVWAAEVIRAALDGAPTFPYPPRVSGRPYTQQELAAWLIYSNPNLTPDGLTAELRAAFPPPAYKVGARHGPHYFSLYRSGKLVIPDSDPRDS